MNALRIATLCAAALLHVPALAQSDGEYGIKAAYLARFGSYIEWPASTFASPSSPFVLCVVGEDPFGEILDKAVAGQRVGTHPVVVRRMKAATRDSGCQILYLGSGGDALRGTPVLTISDASRGGPSNGVVHFIVSEDRVRFEIDDDAASQNGLFISSKLLGLALRVKPRKS